MQRRAMGDLMFTEMRLVLTRLDFQSIRRADFAFVPRIFVMMNKRDHLVGPLKVRKFETSYPMCNFDRRVQSPTKVVDQRGNLLSSRKSIEASDRHVNRRHRPT